MNFKYFFLVLAVPADDGRYWAKHVKVIFYVLILNLLHLMDLTAHSCMWPNILTKPIDIYFPLQVRKSTHSI
jgi:hypothetical protein